MVPGTSALSAYCMPGSGLCSTGTIASRCNLINVTVEEAETQRNDPN